jgi:hypothetical protein
MEKNAAKDEFRTGKGAGQQASGAFAGSGDGGLSPAYAQHQQRKEHLQCYAGGDHAPADGLAMRGEEPRSGKDQRET